MSFGLTHPELGVTDETRGKSSFSWGPTSIHGTRQPFTLSNIHNVFRPSHRPDSPPETLGRGSIQRMPCQRLARGPTADQGLQHQRLYVKHLIWQKRLLKINLAGYADSIFFDNERTLFATFKYVGTDFEGDMERMRANPKVREWWTMTDGMQVGPGDAQADETVADDGVHRRVPFQVQ